jgi:hypothetical protein
VTPTRDVQRNAAFFLGAFGTALGMLGGVMSALGVAAWLAPDFMQTAPDWFFALVIVGLLVLVIGAWPALDLLANRRPDLGGPVMALLGLGCIVLGGVAAFATPWGLTGWLSIAGGTILMIAAYLATIGGGTEPLTWRSLRTERVLAIERRLNPAVGAVVGVVSISSLILLVIAAIDGSTWQTFSIPVLLGVFGLGWLLANRRGRH